MAPAPPDVIRRGSAPLRLILSLLLTGCGVSPTAPSVQTIPGQGAATSPAIPVLIQTFYYSNQALPFPGVAVRVDGALAGTTQADGTLTVSVPMGVETSIEVTVAGYQPAAATGLVRGPGERWSFWLMRDGE